ncbi:MAG: hypothetical protein D6799_07270 [Bacteroidetes bacterium]|jgi:phage-related holin|nr:MAG: hypothetical protein D6799_07270 [Bacteroidota bacterium]
MKLKYIFAFILNILPVFITKIIIDNKELFTVLTILIAIDTATGIAASIKTKKQITSWRMFIGIFLKLVFLEAILYTGAAIQKYIEYDFIGWASIVLCSIEIFSIDENINKVFGFSIITTIKKIYDTNKEFLDKIKN